MKSINMQEPGRQVKLVLMTLSALQEETTSNDGLHYLPCVCGSPGRGKQSRITTALPGTHLSDFTLV